MFRIPADVRGKPLAGAKKDGGEHRRARRLAVAAAHGESVAEVFAHFRKQLPAGDNGLAHRAGKPELFVIPGDGIRIDNGIIPYKGASAATVERRPDGFKPAAFRQVAVAPAHPFAEGERVCRKRAHAYPAYAYEVKAVIT